MIVAKLMIVLSCVALNFFAMEISDSHPATSQPSTQSAEVIIVASRSADAPFPVRWTSEVSLNPQEWPDIGKQLAKPVDIHIDEPMLLVNRGETKSPKTGVEYLALLHSGFTPASNFEKKKESWFMAATLPLSWLQNVKSSKKSFVHEWNPASNSEESLAILPSSLGFSPWDEPTHALFKEEWPNAVILAKHPRPWTIDIDDKTGGESVISIVAWGDSNGDGIEDALLSVNHYATSGTFCTYKYVAVTRESKDGPIKVLNDVR